MIKNFYSLFFPKNFKGSNTIYVSNEFSCLSFETDQSKLFGIHITGNTHLTYLTFYEIAFNMSSNNRNE